MKTQQMIFPLAPHGTATLTLPEVLTPDPLARLGATIGDALRERSRRDGPAAANDPAATEFASWLIHLR